MMAHRVLPLLALASVLISGGSTVVFSAPAPAENSTAAAWSTLHGDVQRSGFYPSLPRGPHRLAWRQELWRELTGPRAEIIVGDGLAFLGTYAGNFYAWNARTGAARWVVRTKGAIGHSPMWQDGTVYVGSMDRGMYAIETATGAVRWRFAAEEGIWVSPLVHHGLVLFGDRAGIFHALDAATGRETWRRTTGDRILTTASLSPDGDRIVFASEDMHVSCLRLSDGELLWQSRKLPGVTVRDYAPVIVGGLALVTTSPVMDFHGILDRHQALLVERTGFQGKDPRYIPGDASDVAREQEFIVGHLRQHPEEQTFFAFRLTDGTEPWIAPLLYTGGLHNPMTPPCVNRQTGEVFTQVRSAYTTWDGGGEVRPFTGFGQLDLATGRVALLDHGYPSKDPSRPAGDKDKPWGTFNYIGDETQALSCAPGFLLCTHQGNIGQLDLKTGLLVNVFGRRDSYGGSYGAANFGWENQGGLAKARAAGQPFGLVNEWHGPARAIISVADDRIYLHVGSQVLCLERRP
jgi:outer membrane protein assembly factor BamB